MNKLGGFTTQVRQEENAYLPHIGYRLLEHLLNVIIMNKSKKSSVPENTAIKAYSYQLAQGSKATSITVSHLRRIPVFVRIVITSERLSLQRLPFNLGKYQKSALKNRALRRISTPKLIKDTYINFINLKEFQKPDQKLQSKILP